MVFGEGCEEVENGGGGFAVEVAGWFIGNEEFGVVHDGAGDGDALFLSAGEFGGAVMRAIGESDQIEGGIDAGPAFGPGERDEQKREFDILEGRENGNEMIELENVADVTGAPLGETGPGEAGHIVSVDDKVTGGGSVDPGDEIEEGGLSRTGWPHEGEELTAGDFQAEFLQGCDEVGSLLEGLGEVSDLDEAIGHVDRG
jgi:hypothetical protein